MSAAETIQPSAPIPPPIPIPTLGSPLAPSVRLVQTPRLPTADPDRLAVTSEDIAKSYYATTSVDEGSSDESAQEKGRRLACEFLEGNFEHVPEDKVAEFLGGPKEVNAAALWNYMQFFGMKGNLVDCFRYVLQSDLLVAAEARRRKLKRTGSCVKSSFSEPNRKRSTASLKHSQHASTNATRTPSSVPPVLYTPSRAPC